MSGGQGTQSALAISAALSSQHPGTCSSVSLQFLSTTPLQRCVVEGRRGRPTPPSPHLLILKLEPLSGWELFASMALEVETPCLYSCCAESHGQHGVAPKGSEANREMWLQMVVSPWSWIPDNSTDFRSHSQSAKTQGKQ